MATLDQLYRAYLNEDPNVSQMKYDPFSWNIEQTFDDTTDDVDTGGGGGTGGITNAYVGGDGGAFDYLQNPLDPITTSGTGEQIVANKALRDLGYDNPWAGEIGPHYEGYSDDMLPAIGEDEDEEVKFLDSPFGWAKQKWGNLTPGQQKTGIIGASSFLPFPLNVAGMASQFLPKSEGYAVGGLDDYQKGIYNTLAGEGMLYKDPGTGLLKDARGKNVYNLAGDYEEGLEDEYNKFMKKYNGRTKFDQLVKEGKIKSKYIMDTVDVYDNVFGYLDQVKENQKKEIDRIQKKIDDELKGKIVPPGPHGEPYDAPTTPIDMGTMRDTGPLHGVAPAAPISVPVPQHISRPDRPHDRPDKSGSGDFTNPGKGSYGPHRAKGGLIRKKYGNGGIVDLL